MHEADDPRWYVGDVVETTETDDGLAITGRFDLDTEFGQLGLPKHQGPQDVRYGYRCAIRNSTKTAAGNEWTELESIEVPVVGRGAVTV